MAYTQSDLDALSKAITAGIKSVTYADGRRVEYQTLADMRALRADMKEEIAAGGRLSQPRTTVGRVIRR
ncbi:phage head-tail joining protein [Sphingomonas desiccabilis]|uniref:Uncharacterized protein n=1 Tax=Sphingomonas desiccabilis TaxID=429134 RepID=A0A4Q2J1T3_9SPHN|nr:hypothetical protein [Sphingomonas desiccabilis]MBB3910846.1 hypothetical protein [Sphingomonas desiccabilis]RXZ35451.1 hypothetical protein EO081_07490 [Sphingomonas desiccabilis]